jgi:hypothetical protein
VAEAPGDLFGTPALAELGVDLGPVRRGEALIASRVGAASPGIGVGELGTVAAIVVGGIAARLAVERTTVATEQSGNGGHGHVVLAEPSQERRYLSAAVTWVYIGSFPLWAENGSLLAPRVTAFVSASVALRV